MLISLILLCLSPTFIAGGYYPILFRSIVKLPTIKQPLQAMAQLSSADLSTALDRILKNYPAIMLWLIEELRIEDFSRRETAFVNLKNVTPEYNIIYIPSANSPLEAFTLLEDGSYIWDSMGETVEVTPSRNNSYIFKRIMRSDGDPDPDPRFDIFGDHDKVMEDYTLKFFGVFPTGVAVYTGISMDHIIEPPRGKREVDEDDIEYEDISMSDQDNTVFVVTSGPIELTRGGNISKLSFVTYGTKNTKDNQIILDVNIKDGEAIISLEFVFIAREGQAWFLDKMRVVKETLKVDMTTRDFISAPVGYSYFCAKDIVFQGKADIEDYILVFHGLQAQPRVKNGAFGPASDCIPYFSAPIWSGLLVSFMLIAVGFLSIIFILDIHTMDKFDDPKARTLNIYNNE